jgi:hypothetical protein
MAFGEQQAPFSPHGRASPPFRNPSGELYPLKKAHAAALHQSDSVIFVFLIPRFELPCMGENKKEGHDSVTLYAHL